MSTARKNWIDVDMDGLRKLLESRGKEFALFELLQNAFDENVTEVRATFSRPVRGYSELIVTDDSPEGFRDLRDAYTLFKESGKKARPEQRGRFNAGEKFVLALCSEAAIYSTTGVVRFGPQGRTLTPHGRTLHGTQFRGRMRLTVGEWEQMCRETMKLIPPVHTEFNGKVIPSRIPVVTFPATLPTVKSDEEGILRPTSRVTDVRLYTVEEGETAILYEMGIPVVAIDAKYHVEVMQKVPLSIDRDNVTPGYLKTVMVEVLNNTQHLLTREDASAVWVRMAASDPRVKDGAIRTVLDLRFGAERVSYDPSDKGSNREAASRDYTVVSGGSLSAGEWENARRAGAIEAAGKLFPTSHGSKVPDKAYDRGEWTPTMRAYARFVEEASPELVGREITVRFIEDRAMVCGQFFGSYFNVNLAVHDVDDWQSNIELMLHELAHTVVKSNDHLSHEFHETVGRLGARLAMAVADRPVLLRSA